jgi:hypothetical protein
MTKKDFRTMLGATVKSQDAAVIERFEDADCLLSQLPKPRHPTKRGDSLKPKIHVVRASFSMAETDYEVIDSLKKAAAREGVIFTASEVARAALDAIAGYDGPAIIAAVQKLQRLRPG